MNRPERPLAWLTLFFISNPDPGPAADRDADDFGQALAEQAEGALHRSDVDGQEGFIEDQNLRINHRISLQMRNGEFVTV